MHYFKVGDQVIQNPNSQDVFAPPRKGVVKGAYPSRLFSNPISVDFGEGHEEEVEEATLSLSDPETGTEVVLWQSHLSFSRFVTFGTITETPFDGKAFTSGGQFTPLRPGLILTRPSSPEHGTSPDLRESTRFLDSTGILVRHGDVVRRAGIRNHFDDVVLWDYSKARWALCPITLSRRLAGRALRDLDDYPFVVVGYMHFIPPFDTGIPVDERLFPSAKLLQSLD